FALTQPWPTGLVVFEALGLGLAAPYLALSLVPAWRRFLPRPGPWMLRLERLLALPLYASVAWLLWVLSRHGGIEGAATAVAGLVLIALAAWLYDVSRPVAAARRRIAGAGVAALVLAAVALSPVAGAMTAPARAPGAADAAFTPRRLDELRRQG